MNKKLQNLLLLVGKSNMLTEKRKSDLLRREEFYQINRFVSITHCIKLLKEWEKEFNEKRPRMAVQEKTPKEYLMEKLKNHTLNRTGNFPIKSVADVP